MNDPIRVLVVEASSGGVVGGSLTGLYHMIRGFDRSRYHFGVALYEKKPIEPNLEALGVSLFKLGRRRLPKEHVLQSTNAYHAVRRAPWLRSVMHESRRVAATAIEDLPTAWQCARVLRRFRPHLVHVGNGLRANFDALLACAALGVPAVCHVKGFEKYSWRERWLAPRIAAIVSMTEAVRDHCTRHGIVHPRHVVIYDALDPHDFVPTRSAEDVRAEFGIPCGAPLVGVVGNIQEWKGQLVFVEALHELLREVPAAYGILIGGVHRAGEEYFRRILQRAAELGLGQRLVVTGFRADVANFVRALDVVVHTSVRPEPFGRVILEGMMCGKPVIATAAGGVPELIEHGKTGFLVPPGQPLPLAQAIAALLGNEDARRSVGAEAKAWAEQRFSLERHVGEMAALYRAVLEENRHS
ncbi:MAG: glycosyltransferase family 4 protein [Candidatus Binatia bacterium]|nr:glycosyltransferase family 4 protein [Candidatus Binatia bacterium]